MSTMSFDDGLSALIALAMRASQLDLATARKLVRAMNDAGYLCAEPCQSDTSAHTRPVVTDDGGLSDVDL